MTGNEGTLGIVGGTGWLGGAIALRCLEAGVVRPERLVVSSRSGPGSRFAAWPEVRHTTSNEELAGLVDLVLLSVRPQQFGELRLDLRGKLVVSVMAGIRADAVRAATGAGRIVRAMPNAAAEIGRSYTPWFAVGPLTAGDENFVRRLFESCGKADRVEDEAHIDYLAGLSGTGPAYPALLADTLLGHALARGIDPRVARRAVEGVVCDASRLLADPDQPFEAVVERLRSYRGVTAAALDAMVAEGFNACVAAGLDAAASRDLTLAAD